MPPSMTPVGRGLVSQPSVSTLMMRAQRRPEGTEVWMEDERQVWALVEVVKQDNTMLTVRHKSSGKTEEIDLVRGKIEYKSTRYIVCTYTYLLSILLSSVCERERFPVWGEKGRHTENRAEGVWYIVVLLCVFYGASC